MTRSSIAALAAALVAGCGSGGASPTHAPARLSVARRRRRQQL